MKFMSTMFLNRARGFAAITAIFIVIVLGGLGIVIATISASQQRASTFDVNGARAYQAARTGIEFGAFDSLRNNAVNCPTIGTTIALTGALAGFWVTVACTGTSHTEAAPMTVYNITATACNRSACPGVPDATYVERQLQLTAASSSP
jgi:MSHA biogenesis protein MshP